MLPPIPVSFAAGAALSSIASLDPAVCVPVALYVPSEFTSCELAPQVSHDGMSFYPVCGPDGSVWSFLAASGTCISLGNLPGGVSLAGFPFIEFLSAKAQPNACTLSLVVR
jgi:hypothetical protein